MSEWEKGICNEKSGLLFSHPCDRLQRNTCGRCLRPICVDHTHTDPVGGQEICTTCMRGSQDRQQQAQDDHSNPRSRHYGHYHDPYFYGSYYGGYWGVGGYASGTSYHHHHDPHDFTEADGESFRVQSDDGFESDMTES